MHHSVTTDHSPTNVPVTDNHQCYGSVVVDVTVSSNPCYETVTQEIGNTRVCLYDQCFLKNDYDSTF